MQKFYLRLLLCFIWGATCGHSAIDELQSELTLHMGLRKTGSTAVQYALGQNADAFLKKDRVLIYNSSALQGQELHAGTIDNLPSILGRRPKFFEVLWDIAQEKGAKTTVLTSETALEFQNEKACALVVRRLNESPFKRWKIVIFLRSPYESLWSSFTQHVKIAKVIPDHSTLVNIWKARLNGVCRFAEAHKDNVVCVSYDTCARPLLSTLWKAAGLGDLGPEYQTSTPKINRSLSMTELNLYLHLIKFEKGGKSKIQRRKLSDHLIVAHPDQPVFYFQHQNLLRLLKERGGDALVKRMNAVLHGGEVTLLSFKPEKYLTEWDRTAIRLEDIEAVLRSHEVWDKFEASPHKEKCPEGFSGVEYLAKHLDVLAQLQNPYQHFLEHGQVETPPQ